MKKLSLCIALLAVAALSLADTVTVKPKASDPHKPKITFGSFSADAISFGTLFDGKKGFASASIGVVNNIGNSPVSLDLFTFASYDGKQLHAGAGPSWKFYDKGGFSASAFVVVDGLNLSGGGNGLFDGVGRILPGFQINVPLGKH